MNKKLYRVKVVLYVMAENESDACLAATRAHFDIFECVARKAEHLEPGWDNAIPYNADDYRTCSEILASQQQAVHPTAYIMTTPPTQSTRIRTTTDAAPALSYPG